MSRRSDRQASRRPQNPRPAPANPPSTWYQRLFEPADISAIAFFRVAFGLLMLWHVLQYLWQGRLERAYLRPVFRFEYPGFEWLERASPANLKLIFWVMAIAALLIALGLCYRVAAAVFFLGHTYTFLLDTALYQNHLYLIALVALLLIAIPAHRFFSIDARLRPKLRANTLPAWCLWLLRFQFGIPYFYGGLAKLNSDWLLRAQPMRLWLREGPAEGLEVSFLRETWAAYAISWGGLLFDLLVVPALLWKRTRIAALILAGAFHLTNSELFLIGVFPWLMIAALTLYLPADWARRAGLVGRFRTAVAAPLGTAVRPRLTLAVLGAWVAFQLLFPFRHLLYPGKVDWTEQGHRFSWRMKLRDKRGDIRYVAVDPESQRAFPISDLDTVVTKAQHRMLLHDPQMMRQLAVHLAQGLREAGRGELEVRVLTSISLNGRPPQPLVDPKADLARVPQGAAGSWIEPLRD